MSLSSPRIDDKLGGPYATAYDHIRSKDEDDKDLDVDEDVAEGKEGAPNNRNPQQQPVWYYSAIIDFYNFVGIRDTKDALDRLECAALEWIPFTVRLNPGHKPRLLMGGILWVIAIAIFLTLFITSYETHAHTSYLSLKNSATCTAVTKTISETFYADEQGHWSTQPDYQSALTWYVLQLNDAQLTDDHYTSFMTQSLKYLQGNASKANKYNTAQTLMVLFTWRSTDINAAVNSTPSAMLYLAADPVHTFSLMPLNYFRVLNSTGYHRAFTSTYNIQGNRMVFRTYDIQNIYTIAQSTSVPLNLSGTSTYTVEVGFNLQSFFVAASINRGLLSFNVLQSNPTVPYAVMPSNFEPYKDPRYAFMDPIYCDKTVQRCVLYVDPWGLDGNLEGAYYPLFEEGVTSSECICPFNAFDEECRFLRFRLALAYLGQSSESTTHPFLSTFWSKMGPDSAFKVWEWLYYLEYISEFYFTFVFDTASLFTGIEVNEFFTTINHPQCNSTKVLPYPSALSKMENTSPTDLSEKYFECKYTAGENWQYALGIAAGQFHVYMVCAVLVIVYTFKLVFECGLNQRVDFKPNFIVTYSLYRDYLEQLRQKAEGRSHVAQAEYTDVQV